MANPTQPTENTPPAHEPKQAARRIPFDFDAIRCSVPIHLPPEVLAELAWRIGQKALRDAKKSSCPNELDAAIEEEVCVIHLVLSEIVRVFRHRSR